MKEEMESLHKNNTWELVNLPKNKNVIDNRWVYKTKHDENGKIYKHRARLVVPGFTQQYGVHYYETFSPDVKYDSVRLIISLAAIYEMNIKQFDVKRAFLYGDLQEEIYMNQPKGFSDHSDKVCRLRKNLYGLKQSSRCWNKKFSYFLQKFSLKTSDADQCVFCKVNGNEKIIVAIFVDDGMIVSISNELTEKL